MDQAQKNITFFQVLLLLAIWCYIIYRVATMEITHDEAFTYLLVKTTYIKALVGTANTHWLNSLVMKLFLLLPGNDDPWKLKMLSVLSWPVYGYFTLRISHFFRNRWLGTLFFIIMVLNPFLVFYFTLSRGYAASCAFIMGTLCMARMRLSDSDIHPKSWLAVFFMATLALVANFTSLYFYLALIAIYGGYLLQKRKTNLLRTQPGILLMLLAGLSVLLSIADLLFIKYYTGDLEFGARENIAYSLAGSVMEENAFWQISFYQSTIAGAIILLLLSMALFIVFKKQWKTKTLDLAATAVYAASFIVLLNLAFHIVFKTPFLVYRTALTFCVVIMTGLFTSLDTLVKPPVRYRPVPFVFVMIFFLLFVFNFVLTSNNKKYYDWTAQSTSKECLDVAERLHAHKVGLNPWHYAVYVNYYRLAYPGRYHFSIKSLSWEDTKHLDNPDQFSDLDVLLLAPPYLSSPHFLDHWTLIASYPSSGAMVIGPKKTKAY